MASDAPEQGVATIEWCDGRPLKVIGGADGEYHGRYQKCRIDGEHVTIDASWPDGTESRWESHDRGVTWEEVPDGQ